MRTLWIVILLAGCAGAQTLATCQADYALWNDDDEWKAYMLAEPKVMREGVPNKTKLNALSLGEIHERINEMQNCFLLTKDRKYMDSSKWYDSMQDNRAFGFLHRHHLMKQFMAEDAAGER